MQILLLSPSPLTWCNSLSRWVLDSRTGFGRFLRAIFSLQRSGQPALHTALFPLPVPFPGIFAKGPVDKLKKRGRQLAIQKAVHVMVMALNYLYCARSFPSLDHFRRQPNPLQKEAYQRLQLLLEACDHGEAFQVAASGRKNLQLVTRLQELARGAETLGLSDPYQRPPKKRVQADNSHPQLSPFSNLIPERLKLSGKGEWPAARYIDPEFYLAYQEPQVLELDRPDFRRGIPNFDVGSKETVFRLFERWDELGLLRLHPRSSITTGDSGRVKIFNAYKDAQWDRQIGDRRERNAWETRISGPSGSLPVGPMIGRVVVNPGKGLRPASLIALTITTSCRSPWKEAVATSFGPR